MRDYNHRMSKQLIDMERTCVTNNLLTRRAVELLHGKYDMVRYRFLTADEFYTCCQNELGHDTHLGEDVKDAVKTWYEHMLKDNAPVIEVGTPATVYYRGDRRAATVTMVEYFKNGKKDAAGNPIPKKIGINLNEVRCLDYYNSYYEVIPMTDPEALKHVHDIFTLRRGGYWVSQGCGREYWLLLGIGYQFHHIDPSF